MRFLKHPMNLTVADLENYDWDLIELPITLDTDAAMEWFNSVKQNYADCAYCPGRDKDIIGNDANRDQVFNYIVNHAIWGNTALQWMMQWSYDRSGVLPSISNGNIMLYPELADPTFNVSNTNLLKYMFGAYETYHQLLGNECFQSAKLLEFQSGDGLQPHVDVDVAKEGKWKFRLSFQLATNSDAWWRFSDDISPHLSKLNSLPSTTSHSREYKLESGKVYLVNTAVTHAVKNDGESVWVMIQSDPNDSVLNGLLQMKELHIC